MSSINGDTRISQALYLRRHPASAVVTRMLCVTCAGQFFRKADAAHAWWIRTGPRVPLSDLEVHVWTTDEMVRRHTKDDLSMAV